MEFFLFIYLFYFGVTPGDAQGLLLALNSGIYPAVLGEPYRMLGIEPGLAVYKANALPAVLLLQPQRQTFYFILFYFVIFFNLFFFTDLQVFMLTFQSYDD